MYQILEIADGLECHLQHWRIPIEAGELAFGAQGQFYLEGELASETPSKRVAFQISM